MRRFRYPPRRWFQVSLRTLFAVIAIVCFFLARESNYYQQQNDAIRQLTEAGASVIVRRSVPKWLFDLSGGRCRYVHSIHQASYIDKGISSRLIEDMSESDTDNAGMYLYFVTCWQGWETVTRQARIEEMLPAISQCGSCQELFLDGSAVTDDHLQSFESLGQLQRLHLYGTRITDAGLVHLRSLKHLENLNVARTKVTRSGAAKLAAALPGLQIDILRPIDGQ